MEWTTQKDVMAQLNQRDAGTDASESVNQPAPPANDPALNDLTTFFGPRAEIFLAAHEKQKKGRGVWRTNTWCWPAFFGGFVWFFYRKMYGIGAAMLVLPIIIGVLYPKAGGASFAYIGSQGKGFYVWTAQRRIKKADKLGLVGAEREEYLRRAGGVSLTAGILAGVVYASLLALLILGIHEKS